MKFIYLTPLLLFSLVFTSCNKMLDIKPVNRMMPVSISDYESVLLGGYPRVDYFMKTELMTDNIYANMNIIANVQKDLDLWFTWNPSKQSDGVETDPYWGQLYTSIYYANSVLDNFNERQPASGEKNQFETVKGEAYALRAWCYFYLVNYYAEPYSAATVKANGVPMPLSAKDVHQNTQNNVREPLEKVYAQILSDLDQASSFLSGKKSINKFRFDATAVKALQARVYLFMGDYEKAITAATDVIVNKPLSDMNNMQARIDEKTDFYAFSGNVGFIDGGDYKNEVLFFTGGTANTNMYYHSNYMFRPSVELLALCNRPTGGRDYRRYIFSTFYDLTTPAGKQNGPTLYNMYAKQENPCYYIGLKLGETYVIRAEAYARLKQKDKAIADLNTLLTTRIRKGEFVPLVASDFTDATALNRVLEERRIETSFEGGLRWMDLRRNGKPALSHVYKNGQVYELKQNDNRYLLQIPQSEIINSPNMPLNP
ncbi:RagB/SusD family nutrient uptake outer membrane protein [Chitinophaga qingshengii]|uniref:RagB/SusD family nutrient uptake outer membrane protein n=1 Tax=Chitinophaga qingshengii TaxID=1569794 RepID=A0ABR7TH86_9BACT|nr:RagB/SusD family nutrient uptake outer membrane protein [Chitinophaga qingshengii]MBC9928888.1 RagB/SusD family nutrient uptake outer membrane protein [Chitinophaga qingshengii]